MGSGIAQVFAQHGFAVTLYDLNREMLHKAQSEITSALQQMAVKQKITPAEKAAALSRIRFTNETADCKADLIMEAIVENAAAKTALFRKMIEVNGADAIYATNTSSLSVNALAKTLPPGTRFAGMHFFNPAPVMKLVEVVETAESDEQTIAYLISLANDIGKVAVRCKDAPGFIVNRVARPYYLEALRLAEKGITFPQIDELMESTGFRMGPFRLMDLIGIDVNFSVTNIVYEAMGKPSRLQPSDLQKQKVDEGHWGRKTGKGYYAYPQR